MAPEWLQSKQFSAKSDAWALAVVFLEILTRKLPYPEYTNQDFALGWKKKIRKIRGYIPLSTPTPVRSMLELCWVTNPDERYSVDDVLDVLRSEETKEAYQDDQLGSPSSIKVGSSHNFVNSVHSEHAYGNSVSEMSQQSKPANAKSSQDYDQLSVAVPPANDSSTYGTSPMPHKQVGSHPQKTEKKKSTSSSSSSSSSSGSSSSGDAEFEYGAVSLNPVSVKVEESSPYRAAPKPKSSSDQSTSSSSE